MAQHRVRLHQDPPVQLDDGDRGVGVHLLDRGLLVRRVLVETVADIVEGDAGVDPEQTDDLAAPARGEVEVVD